MIVISEPFLSTLQKVKGGGAMGATGPQYLSDQLTPFELERADYPHLQSFSPSGITAIHPASLLFIPLPYILSIKP